jgi:hypothetical protein
MSAAAVGLVGLSGVVPGSRSPLVRLAVAAAVGWLVGDYMALELVPGQAVLQVRVQGLHGRKVLRVQGQHRVILGKLERIGGWTRNQTSA